MKAGAIRIFPFRGLIYNRHLFKDINEVLVPPYDVIGRDQQNAYYKRSRYSLIRVVLGKEYPTDTELDNRYTRALHLLNEWERKKVIRRSPHRTLYFYAQEYRLEEGTRKTQKGIIALLRLRDFGDRVLPHERTLSKPKLDRLSLLRSCHANFSPLFMLYQDEGGQIEGILQEVFEREEPHISFTDEAGTNQSLRIVSDENVIKRVQACLMDKVLYIADGHHRYETALNFRNEMRKNRGKFTGRQAWDHTMVYLVNMNDKGLTILSAHRLLQHIPALGLPAVKEKMRRVFHIKEVSSISSLLREMKPKAANEHIFGAYFGEEAYYLLTLKDERMLAIIEKRSWRRQYRVLDVTIMHSVIINSILNGGQKMPEKNIAYTKDANRACRFVKSGEYEAAFFLNPTKVEQVSSIASRGERMPGKATYFYPKPPSGLVINRFRV